MTAVTVIAPGKVNRRIAGVTFSEGRAEVDTGSAAYQFFRRRGFIIAEPVALVPVSVSGSISAEKLAVGSITVDKIAAVDPLVHFEPEPEPVKQEPVEPHPVEPQPVEPQPVAADPAAPVPTKPERPHPVQGNKAAWFDYLSTIKPDHGFDLEAVQRKDLIAAANKVDGITAE